MISIRDYNLDKIFRKNMDYIIIGCTPSDEECIQAGNDIHFMKIECKIYCDQIIRKYGKSPEDGYFFLLINTTHDAGVYIEVAYCYSLSEKSSSEIYAFQIEAGDEKWDYFSIERLIEEQHPLYYKNLAPIVKFKKVV